ncbi:MAG: hypothetical protein HQL11_03130 [Candidatus Omnitrophica bacterium]|nr:hypothetical protein [Candidatus Omnitrophota bacterium]
MKQFVGKLFLYVFALSFLVVAAILVGVRLGFVPWQDMTALYEQTIATGRLDVAGMVLLVLWGAGIFIWSRILSSERRVKSVVVRDKGEEVRVPLTSIKEFVDKILDQRSSIDDCKTRLGLKGPWLLIRVEPVFKMPVSVIEESQTIRQELKVELEKVFSLTQLKIDFEVRGIEAVRAIEKSIKEAEAAKPASESGSVFDESEGSEASDRHSRRESSAV